MKEFDLVIKDENGIHARPAGIVVKAVKKTGSKAKVIFGEKECDMTKLLQFMGMGIKKGDTITVRVEGGEEEASAAAIKKAFEDNGLV